MLTPGWFVDGPVFRESPNMATVRASNGLPRNRARMITRPMSTPRD